MHRTAILALVLAAPLLAADPAKELEARLQKVIDDASPTVVAVVVAHAKYPAAFAEKGAGKLGKYESPPAHTGFRGPLQPAPIDPLDLRDPANAADHTFGAGLVLDAAKRLVLVPYHLIEGATKVFVRGAGGKGSYANVRAADARSDLAVLELLDAIPGAVSAKLATVHLVDAPGGAKTNLKQGSLVVALGHPLAAGLGDGTPSGSLGMLSNIRRRSAVAPGATREVRDKPLHTYGSLLQTDARVALGASGSAVLNLDGEVIGLASAVAAVSGSEVNGGFALPMDVNYRRIIDVLATGKEVEYGFLGVLPEPSATAAGVEVKQVTPGCPAAEADVRVGDIIQSVDGNPLKSTDDLHLYVGAALAGSKVTLALLRGREAVTARVTLAKNHNPMPFVATVQPPAVSGLHVDYASIRYAQAANNRVNANAIYPVAGVAVRELDTGSAAEKKFADAGDISRWLITHVDGKAVATPAAFLAAAAGKASVKLTLADITTPNKTTVVVLP